VFIPFNPVAPENQWMVNTTFVTHSYSDIYLKVQKLVGFTGMNATQLLEMANRVFVN
jgi:hypothetical protein